MIETITSQGFSYICLGLAVSIGLLIYMIQRDYRTRKKRKEDAERERQLRMLKEILEEQKRSDSEEKEDT